MTNKAQFLMIICNLFALLTYGQSNGQAVGETYREYLIINWDQSQAPASVDFQYSGLREQGITTNTDAFYEMEAPQLSTLLMALSVLGWELDHYTAIPEGAERLIMTRVSEIPDQDE